MNNYIIEYYQAIQDGSIVVGHFIKQWYEYIIKGLEDKSFFYDAKKARLAINFIEQFCHHNKGKLAPALLTLELWQKAFLSVVFGIVDKNGTRQFREVVLIVARKNGKTLFASGIAEYMTFLDDYGAEIYFAAPKLDQAKICFEAYLQSIHAEPELNALAKKRRTDVYVESRNATAKPLAFSEKKSDGLNITLCVADEFAAWSGASGLKFYEVIKSSFGARTQPLLLAISTANYESGGVYDELMRRCTSVLNGTSKEKRLAPFLYMIDDAAKWNDINELRKSNPNMGVSVSADYLLEELAVAETSLSKRAEFCTKYACIKQNSSQAWLSTKDVDKCMGDHMDPEQFRGCYCVAGVDLSQARDLTSACVVIERNGELYVLSRFWLPGERIDEAQERDGVPYKIYERRGLLTPSGANFIDYNDVFSWFVELVEKYEIYPLWVGYDRYNATYYTDQMRNYGFHMDDVYQGDNLWPVIQEAEGIIKDGRLKIGDNDLLKIHFLDSAVKMNNERGRGKLVKVRPSAHIDGMAALLDALTVRQKWYAEIGGQLANEV